jgi:hypothetical protein
MVEKLRIRLPGPACAERLRGTFTALVCGASGFRSGFLAVLGAHIRVYRAAFRNLSLQLAVMTTV